MPSVTTHQRTSLLVALDPSRTGARQTWSHRIDKALRLLSCTLAIVIACANDSVQAELIEDITVLSPKAIGLANAVTADPPGIDSVHFNPAGLVNIDHSQTEIKMATFSQSNTTRTGPQRVDPGTLRLYESLAQSSYPSDPLANQSGESGDPVLLLPGGVSEEMAVPVAVMGGIALRPPGDKLVFATAGYSPMMVGVTRSDDDLGRYQATETAITRITYFSPSMGYRIDDTWAVGASLGFSYQGMSLITDVRSPQAVAALLPLLGQQLTGQTLALGPYSDIAEFSVTLEDYVSTHLNLGALWTPVSWVSIGAAYRSATRSTLKGDFAMKYSSEFLELSNLLKNVTPAIGGEAEERGNASLEFKTPPHFSLGISVQLTPRWKINLDRQFAFYEQWDAFTVHFDQNVDFLVVGSLFDADSQPRSLTLQRNYRNSRSWSIGSEYQLGATTILRVGFQQRNSAIPDNALDLTIPVAAAKFYGLGLSRQFEDHTRLDLSIGYLTSDYDVDYGQSSNANSEDPYDLLYNPYVFLSLESTTRSMLLALAYTKPY